MTFKFRTCLAVAQRIEHLLDGKAGRRFESYQPDHTLEALGFRHPGLLCLSREVKQNGVPLSYEIWR